MKVTIIAADEVDSQRDRDGFVPVCCYGIRLCVEPGEIGGIFQSPRNHRLAYGVWVSDAECVERIVVGD